MVLSSGISRKIDAVQTATEARGLHAQNPVLPEISRFRLFPRYPAIPDARGDEDEATARCEINQERRWQIKFCTNRHRERQPTAQIRVKRAGPRALQALLQNQFHRLVGAREGGGAVVGADHALRRGRFGAIGAQRVRTRRRRRQPRNGAWRISWHLTDGGKLHQEAPECKPASSFPRIIKIMAA
jgi:hypothetical protein